MPKPCAYSLIRTDPHYRRDAFESGLKAADYEVRHGAPATFNLGDLLLSWNRYGAGHDACLRAERDGATVLIAENGFVGQGGVSPHSMAVREPYALARHFHNDSTVVPDGGPERWQALGVDLKPWREDGAHVLVCPNRSFGIPGRMMPPDWANDVVRRLAKVTKREIRVRPHPGNNAPRKPLVDDLAGAWVTFIWSSSAGVHSLIAGVPVVCEAPYWICKESAMPHILELPLARYAKRLPALQRLAWAQFTTAEIASGEPFRLLAA